MAGLVKLRGVAMLAALALLAGCGPQPTRDPATLKAIRTEAQAVMARQPAGAPPTVPKQQWSRTIATLQPDRVAVYPDGLEITTRAWFDGGWGYFVPRTPETQPQPEGRFSPAGEGVYWYHPY